MSAEYDSLIEPVNIATGPPPIILPGEKHSGIGISSFAISVVAGVGMFVVFGVAGMIQVSTPGGMDEHSAPAVLIGLGIIGLIAVDVVAFALGVAGVLQKNRKKLFAILGTIFSTVTVLGAVALMIVGMMARN